METEASNRARMDETNAWNAQHALFNAEYAELIEQEGPALLEYSIRDGIDNLRGSVTDK